MIRNIQDVDSNATEAVSAWWDSPDVVFNSYLAVIVICLVVMVMIVILATLERYRRSRRNRC